jgi:hypothetical protein
LQPLDWDPLRNEKAAHYDKAIKVASKYKNDAVYFEQQKGLKSKGYYTELAFGCWLLPEELSAVFQTISEILHNMDLETLADSVRFQSLLVSMLELGLGGQRNQIIANMTTVNNYFREGKLVYSLGIEKRARKTSIDVIFQPFIEFCLVKWITKGLFVSLFFYLVYYS